MTEDPIVLAARFLQTQITWIVHAYDGAEPYAVRAFAEIDACAGRMRGIVNGVREQRFLGGCGAMREPLTDEERLVWGPGMVECQGYVYAPVGGAVGKCRTCKAEFDVEARREWIVAMVRDWPFSAPWIARELRVNVKTVRTWANRGQLATYWRTDGGLVTPWTDTDDPDEIKARGDRLHYVGDVERLADEADARRTEAQQKRERRAASTDERMSA
jgi:hypothetical protein